MLVLFMILFIPSILSAHEYSFLYNTQNYSKELPVFELKIQADSYSEAFEKSSVKCFDQNISNKMNEDQKLQIIDVCVNPRNKR